MKRDDSVFLRHILDAVDAVERFTPGATHSEFLRNEMMHQAVVRELEIIGEAAARVSPDFRREYPDIAWGQIIGMRNRLVHAYFEVDLNIVWEIVNFDLPPLKEHAKRILGELGNANQD